jgi:hypothetical protein
MRRVVAMAILGWSCGVWLDADGAQAKVPQWAVFETSFRSATEHANPYTDVELSCAFKGPGGTTSVVEGFWDGSGTWRVRFAPGAVGKWTYETTSNDGELHGKKGAFRCVPSKNHGFVGIDPRRGHHFAYSDGTPFYFFGDSDNCWDTPVGDEEPYWGGWFWEDGSFQRYIDARAEQGFTVQAFAGGTLIAKPTFRDKEQRNEGGPPFFDYDLDRLNPGYFQWADKRTQYACSKGFLCVIMLGWPDQDVHKMDWKKLERGWRYVIARYAAYNVMWLLFGEYDEAGGGARKLVNHFARITRRYDPYHHLLSTHATTSSAPLAGEEWLDVVVHQSRDWEMVRRDRRFGKPVVNWEWYYEKTMEESLGWEHIISDADEIRRGAWRVLCRGGYIVYNLVARNRRDYMANLERPGARYCLIATRFFREQLPFQNLEPAEVTDETGKPLPAVATGDGREWVVYLETASEAVLSAEKPPTAPKAEWLDPRTGETRPAKNAGPRRWRKPDAGDWILHVRAR